MLATTIQQVSSHGTGRGPVIPGTGCHLLIENQFISAKHRRHLRTRRGRRQLLQYIQNKHHVSDADVSHIDWDSQARAMRTFQHTSHTFLVKILSKWLPDGKQVNRYKTLQLIPVNVHRVSVRSRTSTTFSDVTTGGNGGLRSDKICSNSSVDPIPNLCWQNF
jgi:hypothetical protein